MRPGLASYAEYQAAGGGGAVGGGAVGGGAGAGAPSAGGPAYVCILCSASQGLEVRRGAAPGVLLKGLLGSQGVVQQGGSGQVVQQQEVPQAGEGGVVGGEQGDAMEEGGGAAGVQAMDQG